jgi:hypothetical protein
MESKPILLEENESVDADARVISVGSKGEASPQVEPTEVMPCLGKTPRLLSSLLTKNH